MPRKPTTESLIEAYEDALEAQAEAIYAMSNAASRIADASAKLADRIGDETVSLGGFDYCQSQRIPGCILKMLREE